MTTREQERAKRAYDSVTKVCNEKNEAEYRSFALKFPSLIHNCGLAQSIAFAEAKRSDRYLKHLVYVLKGDDRDAEWLAQRAREANIVEYRKLSRDTLVCASWLKRYTEALLKGK